MEDNAGMASLHDVTIGTVYFVDLVFTRMPGIIVGRSGLCCCALVIRLTLIESC